MTRSRKFYLSLLGVVTLSATTANTVLDILNASSLLTTSSPLRGIAAAASALDVLALGSVTLFSVQYAWTKDGFFKNSRQGKHLLVAFCVSSSAVALVVSLATIVITRSQLSKLSSTNPDILWGQRLIGQIVTWILACLSQIALFTSPLWWKPTPKALSVMISGPRDSVMSELRHSNTPHGIYMMEPTQPSSPLAAMPSPTFSARSSQSLQSWRDSLHHVIRPATSRSKLVKPRSSRSVYSDVQSFDSASQDGFDKWEADPQIVLQLTAASAQLAQQMPAAPTKGTVLEAIPQSRPGSPARALDGPFPASDDDEELPPPPKMMLDTSRPPSPSVSEAHIHPLFRSESPVPPPAATPGTSIIASPLSDQAIACPPRPYSRMRSSSNLSRTASPSRLHHAQSFTNDRTMSPHSDRSRSTSPPSRGMTPPIPDFVLNASPRSSTSHSLRKVNLQLENSRSNSGV
ncbi:hypothetical protein DM02DRAFT_282524 [Periconia macrospinosa]|uniref:Uncharacterized protein n=1 Tax=Periconia macrospinosa TaxID=97972 RepID=A0A2V1D2Q4_9PLEO|nr:hypothetical protein DM02DRAFT_282524 [Periconia macrospinosa]